MYIEKWRGFVFDFLNKKMFYCILKISNISPLHLQDECIAFKDALQSLYNHGKRQTSIICFNWFDDFLL